MSLARRRKVRLRYARDVLVRAAALDGQGVLVGVRQGDGHPVRCGRFFTRSENMWSVVGQLQSSQVLFRVKPPDVLPCVVAPYPPSESSVGSPNLKRTGSCKTLRSREHRSKRKIGSI